MSNDSFFDDDMFEDDLGGDDGSQGTGIFGGSSPVPQRQPDINLGANSDDAFFNSVNNNDDDFFGGANSSGSQSMQMNGLSNGSTAAGDPSAGQYTMSDSYVPDMSATGTDQQDDGTDADKKKAIIIIGAGAGLFLVVLIIGSLFLGKKNKQPTPAPVSKETVQIGSNTGTSTVGGVSSSRSGAWTAFAGESLNVSDPVEGVFTITQDITYMAKTSGLNEMELKAVLTGSIGGMIGTYELEVPYSIALNLARGNNFAVYYRIAQKGDQTFICDLSYMPLD